MNKETLFSPCRKYRYTLWRSWADDLFANRTKEGLVMFIGLNPSTADETLDDPTIRRCIDFAKRWSYVEMCMTNLFAFRATEPLVMKAQKQPIGCDNTNQIREVAERANIIVAAWGRDGKFGARDAQVFDALQSWKTKLHHLGLNNDGTPKHPLYLRADTKPILFA